VGVDDFAHSVPLLDVAAAEAVTRGSALWLAHVYSGFAAPGLASDVFARREAVALLATAADHVRSEHPGLHVETLPMSGPPAHALADAVNGCAASLLVVGGRGHGGFAGQLLGSVPQRVLTLAHCPVLVLRGQAAPGRGRVMIGVDTAEPVSGPETIEFAFEEAERRRADLYAVNAWEDETLPYLSFDEKVIHMHRETELARARARLEATLAPWAAKYPAVRLKSQALAGSPTRLLVESTALADLLVVGGRIRHLGHEGMYVGPLTHAVLRHAHCPVAVVPEH